MIKKILLGFFLLQAISVFAQDGNILLSNIQEKFNSIQSLKADYLSIINSGNSQIKIDGTIIYSKGNKFRLNLKDKTILSDGNTVWNVDNKLNRVIISNFEDDQSNPSLEKYIFDYPSKCSVKICENNSLCIQLLPNEPNLPFKQLQVNVSSNYIINSFEMIDYTNAKFEVFFNNILIDVPVVSTDFTYIPTEGVKVIDLR